MEIKVRLFGILAEKAGSSEISINDIENTDALQARIDAMDINIDTSNCVLAVNRQVVRSGKKLQEGDEVALMPPFAGG